METQTDVFEPGDYRWRGLTLTPAAVAHIRHLVEKTAGLSGIRLGVKPTGCAGFGYVLEQVTEPVTGDLLFEQDGARLWVPLGAMPYLDGTEVDYAREGLNQVFKFNNPKAQHACGCGESFGV